MKAPHDALTASLVVFIAFSSYAQTGQGSIPLLRAKARFESGASPDYRIVGGNPEKIEDSPWQVALVYAPDANNLRAQFCGGTLISASWVLTAAHCVDQGTLPSQLEVFYGNDDLRTATPKRAKVLSVLPHKSWKIVNSAAKEFDIALIRIEPVQIDSRSRAIDLPSAEQSPLIQDTPVKVTGWGVTEFRREGSFDLQAVTVPFVVREKCTDVLSYRDTEVARTAFCAGKTGYDSCKGDSGGPVVMTVGGVSRLMGIVSWGRGCGLPDRYGVYTNVQSFLPWISVERAAFEGK